MRLYLLALVFSALLAALSTASATELTEVDSAEAEARAYTKYDGVGFSGSGLLLLYQLGVLKALKDNKFVPNKVGRLSGLSGGALVAATECSQVKVKEAKVKMFALLEECAADAPFYCFGKLDAKLEAFLNAVVPAKTFAKCNNKLYVDTSRVLNSTGSSCADCVPSNLAPKIVNRFNSRQELIDVLRASSFLAQGVSSPTSCTLEFRDKHFCDGGYANREIPCPTGSTKCVKVSSYAGTDRYQGTSIYPGIRGEDTLPVPVAQWNSMSLNAVAVNAHKLAIFRMGREDAKFWLSQNA